MSASLSENHRNIVDLLSQIEHYTEMVDHNVDNKFMQDEFVNRRSGLVKELGKLLQESGVDLQDLQ